MPRFLKDQKKLLIFAGLLFVQLIVVSLQVPLGNEPSFLEKGLFFVFAPLQRAVHGLFQTTSRLWNRYLYLRQVETQNQAMREELFHLRQENLRLQNGLLKLRQTRDIEEGLKAVHTSFQVADVIGVDAANIYKSVFINKGARQGIQADMAVVDRRGNLIGRIVNPITPHEATVQLLTDGNSSVSVRSEPSRVLGQLAGNSKNGTCVLKYVLATDDALAEGEEILTTGYDKIFPAGIKIGRVLSVAADNSLFKKIVVKPYLDFRELSPVAVLTLNTDSLF